MTKRLPILALALIGALAITTSAAAKPVPVVSPAQVEVGAAGIGTNSSGVTFLLLPVRYPLQFAGRVATLRVRLVSADGTTMRGWIEHEKAQQRSCPPARPAAALHLRPSHRP